MCVSQLHGFSFKVTPNSLSSFFLSVPDIGKGRDLFVFPRTTISQVFSRFKDMRFSNNYF